MRVCVFVMNKGRANSDGALEFALIVLKGADGWVQLAWV